MSRIAATDRMTRLIAAIPWIAAQDGAPLDEIAERFDYPRELLLEDLQEVVFYVGVPPYTPDTLIEVLIEDDSVWIDYADWFERPMRLSGPEILALLAAGEAALGFDNQDEAGALARGLAKLRLATGSSADVVDVGVDTGISSALPSLRAANMSQRCVDITYYGYDRNSRSTRRIEPSRFFLDAGRWYVGAYCHRAEAERVFRVDRIEAVIETDQPFTQPLDANDQTSLFGLDEGDELTIEAPAERAYLFDGVPTKNREFTGDTMSVTLTVASTRWLEQLLLSLGPDGKVVEGANPVDVAHTAQRVRERYV